MGPPTDGSIKFPRRYKRGEGERTGSNWQDRGRKRGPDGRRQKEGADMIQVLPVSLGEAGWKVTKSGHRRSNPQGNKMSEL